MKRIFIGSSTKALEKARIIQFILNGIDGVEAICWSDDDVFSLSHSTINELENATREFSAGVFIFDRDDELIDSSGNGRSLFVPRDNVVAEAGMFIGVLGIKSVVLCTVPGIKSISDFDGITRLVFDVNNIKLMEIKLKKWVEEDVIDTIVSKPRYNAYILPRNVSNIRYEVDTLLHISDGLYKKIRCIKVMNISSNLIINPEVAELGHRNMMGDITLSFGINKIMKETQARMQMILAEPSPHILKDISYKVINKVEGSVEQTLRNSYKVLLEKMDVLKCCERFSIHSMKISMPYAIFNVEFMGAAKKYNYVKVDLYSPIINNEDERRSFIIWEIADKENYDFFVNNFNDIILNNNICREVTISKLEEYAKSSN